MMIAFPTACSPLVPRGDEEDVGVGLGGALHLLSEEDALARGLQLELEDILFSIREGQKSGLTPLGEATARGGVGQNARRDGHFLLLAGGGVLGDGLGGFVHPCPHIPPAVHVLAECPAAADGEGLQSGLVLDLLHVAEEQGLSLVHGVEITVLTRGVDVVPDILEHAGVQFGVIRHEEADIGSIHTLFTHSVVLLEDGHIGGGQGISVGHVQIDEIHADIAEHGGVLADDPLIVGEVVAEVGLTPVVSPAHGALGVGILDGGVTALLVDGVVIVEDLIGVGGAGLNVPDLVEDTHQLILHVIGTVGHEAILVVHAYPCVVVEVAEGLGIRGGVFGAHLVIPADLHVIKGALALVPRRCPEADKAVSAKIVTQRVGDLGLTVSVKDGHVVLVLDDEAADELLAAILLEID